MRTVGLVTTIVVAVIGLGVVFIGIRSIPDIRRYFKMRSM